MNNATKVCVVCKKELHSSQFYSFLEDIVCSKCTIPNPTCDDKTCCEENIKPCNGCGTQTQVRTYKSGKTETRCNTCKKGNNKPKVKSDEDEDIEYPNDNKNEEEDSDFEP